MGNSQGTAASWSVDDWAYGTGANAVPADEVVAEVRKIPTRYFGGKAIENDASMHQMQNDLLSFDDTLKRIFFRRKKTKRSRNELEPAEDYYPDEQAMPDEQLNYAAEEEEPTYLSPTSTDRNASSRATTDSSRNGGGGGANTSKLIWRCAHCTEVNKITENSCHRCGQAETKF